MPVNDSPAVEVAPIREMLRLYCRALSDRAVDILDSQRLVEKNIGWSRSDVATGDGSAIFLPSRVDRFEARAANFEFLKVLLTQQAGHLEFGSFDFEFDRASTLFHDWRPKLQRLLERTGNDIGAPAPTELSRFFRLFPGKRLAFDIFSIVESARIEARVVRAYRGIAPAYGALRQRALALRREIIYLPAREALIEFMMRVTLGQRGGVRVPAEHAALAMRVGALLRFGSDATATVEDAAEATLRVYALLSAITNEYFDEVRFSTVAVDEFPFDSANRARPGDGADLAGEEFLRPLAAGREKDYCPPQGVDYRGEFNPELAQLLSRAKPRSHEQRKAATPEELAEMLHHRRPRAGSEMEGEEEDAQSGRAVRNLMRELERREPGKRSVQPRAWLPAEEATGPLSATQPNTYVYDEWDVFSRRYRPCWCKIHESIMACGDLGFYRETLRDHARLLQQIRREFERVAPELYHREKRLADGIEHDLDAAVEALTDLRIGITPSEKVFWRHYKRERDVAVALLLDMSGSTGETMATTAPGTHGWGGDEPANRPARAARRIIDVEKEAIIVMMDALEGIGDRYGVYGFSGHGREHVEFFVIKEFDEEFSLDVAKRFGRIGPLHATRMGPAIRHATVKLRRQQTRSKYLFMISDGRPQDRGYSQESSEKAYAVQDTRMALIEARRQGIHSFCLTVDKEGNDYLRTMMDEFGYEVLADVTALPKRLPQLYKSLTT